MSIDPEYINSLRLCEILKWAHFDGYGFNLHAEKGKLGQYIGKVDEGSPAEAAGLKAGDRIIEVNGVNIANENHKQAVQRIRAVEDKTELLVVDQDGEGYFKSQNIILKSSLPFVVKRKTPEEPIVESAKIEDMDQQTVASETTTAEYANDDKLDKTTNDNGTNDDTKNSLNLNMTAKELRAQLAAKKKYDPKKDHIDLKKKYDIVQKL